jgi:hypothetical protein
MVPAPCLKLRLPKRFDACISLLHKAFEFWRYRDMIRYLRRSYQQID